MSVDSERAFTFDLLNIGSGYIRQFASQNIICWPIDAYVERLP
jgi:hypothetical protein